MNRVNDLWSLGFDTWSVCPKAITVWRPLPKFGTFKTRFVEFLDQERIDHYICIDAQNIVFILKVEVPVVIADDHIEKLSDSLNVGGIAHRGFEYRYFLVFRNTVLHGFYN